MYKKLVLLSLLLTYTVAGFCNDRFFKYVDKEGNVIIGNNLPAEYANNGYAIVTSRGNVLEVVPPKQTDEQLAI
jgi:hypothetical protein